MEDWTEKYRPKSLGEIVGNKPAIEEIINWADNWNKQIPKRRALILEGKPGIGKTSCALALAKDYGWSVIEMNTSDARNATKIKNVATAGALNETFDNNGRFVSSQNGGRKLIILDEADNLYERVKSNDNKENNLSDKGGKRAIVDTIKITNQPIILIVNDYYNLIKGSGEILKRLCKLIKFYNPYSKPIFELLKKICIKEKITIDTEVLYTLSERCQGDIRSAINDLQSICLGNNQVDMQLLNVLGYRDRTKIIFDVLRDIFKSQNIQSIKHIFSHLDEDPNSFILWLNENLPIEYINLRDLAKGYEALSKADIFLGRTYRTQNYILWSYACDIMNSGIATAKTHNYLNKKYNFPFWLRTYKTSKSNRDIRDSILKKISNVCNNSNKKSKKYLLIYFMNMFKNNTNFAINMKNKLNLTESEIKYLLGKDFLFKLKEILEPIKSSDIENGEKKIKLSNEIDKIEDESRQQSLLEF
jgi:replication factor C large subunit